MTSNEIWKDIKGYEGQYQVSNLGNVRSINYKCTGETKLLSLNKINTGYLTCHLRKNGNQKQLLVHRLVADMFLDNKYLLPEVNHKNENKNDNRVENLEWCSSKYNCNYGNHNNNIKNALKNNGITKIFDLCGENNSIIKRYYSITECSKEINISVSTISKYLKNKKKYKNYLFVEVTNE